MRRSTQFRVTDAVATYWCEQHGREGRASVRLAPDDVWEWLAWTSETPWASRKGAAKTFAAAQRAAFRAVAVVTRRRP